MKKKLLSISILILSFLSISQDNEFKTTYETNTIYGELFGQGFGGSVNYDKLVNTSRKIMNSHTLGITIIPKKIDFGSGLYYGGHYAYNYIVGKKNHHFELGVGLSVLYADDLGNRNTIYTYLTPKFGYRYQRPTGGLFFKANVNVMLALVSFQKNVFSNTNSFNAYFFHEANDIGSPIVPWPGFSIGYTFK
jgi:hypothetical protein